MEELDSTTSELEEALREQQAEASDAVEQWSARWSELDALKSQLETKLETLASERDDLVESLQRERENGGREMIDRIERERNIERAEWNAEREAIKARIDDQNESLRENSQNLTAASEELAQMRTTAELTVDAWKGEYTRCASVSATKYPFHNLIMFLLFVPLKIGCQNWRIPSAS